MDSVRLLSILLGLGGFVVVMYTTSELAGLLFGTEWMPMSVQRLGQLDRAPATVNRFGRGVVHVALFAALQTVVVAVLTTRRQELDLLNQALFAGELLATIVWIGWLVRLHARGHRVADLVPAAPSAHVRNLAASIAPGAVELATLQPAVRWTSTIRIFGYITMSFR